MQNITTKQLIEILLILSNLSKKQIAERMNISGPTVSNMLSRQNLGIDSIARIFKATGFPFRVCFDNQIINNFNYWQWSIENPAQFKKETANGGCIKNVIKHFQALGSEFNVIIHNSKYIIT